MKINPSNAAELFVWTDVDSTYEDDFNEWYDREHMAERVAIEGFQWARRYRSTSATARRYLALYRTENIKTFSTQSYQNAFQNQTNWSNTNFERMTNTNRRVMHVTHEVGFGNGAAIALITLDTADFNYKAVNAVIDDITQIQGVLAVHYLKPDEALSTPLPSEDPSTRKLEASLVIDTTSQDSAELAAKSILQQLSLAEERAAIFDFMWELRSEDLS
ncbi:DUF4286 family protein [Leucothrix arctica]|uniref:Uncharacterized protein n=1 Tax=Leucothrix arctica TaxID=1481894 RepID=A0A317C7N5_9GAMM|nr:DUF4286 family protein [Leucothrix arctica]PWQ93383.1 hypothetical protein DKT75_17250 [Leucothrix arctica]